MQDGVVDAGADVVAEWPASEGRGVVDVTGDTAGFEDHALCPPVYVQKVCAHSYAALQGVQNVGDQGASFLGTAEFCAAQDLNHAGPF
ncbi:hypothetical protein D3C73_1202740 [compost metagenome]